jgi:diguanylate cyclase (GGDEF)-like protein
MSILWRSGGGSLAVRLAAIALVPMLALSAFAYASLENHRATADDSVALVDNVVLQRHLAAVITPVNVERIALVGMARIDELGLERAAITQFTGVDFEATYEQNRQTLDIKLGVLATDHSTTTLPDGTLLGRRIDELVADIDEQRRLSVERKASAAGVDAVFEELDSVIQAALFDSGSDPTDSALALRDTARLDALARTVVSAGELTQTSFERLLNVEPGERLDVDESIAVYQTRLATFTELLGPLERDALADVRDELVPVTPDITIDPTVGGGEIANDANAVADLAGLFLDQISLLDSLNKYSAAFHERVLTKALDRSAAAQATAARVQMLVAAVAFISLLTTVLVLFTTARPLTRLATRALAISDGDMSVDPLRPRGPRVVRRLTEAMNQMLVTLNGVNSQIDQMSNGEIDGAASDHLPGAIGVSMRQSVARLSNMTEQLAYQAHHDPLTGLPNRFAAMERLDALFASTMSFSLLFVDIDGFKSVNDTQGHEAGDAVLREIGRRLSEITQSGEFVARLGGDEFIVIATDSVGTDAAVVLGMRIIQDIERPYGAEQTIFTLSASIGVVASTSADNALDALRQADSALYSAKRRGRGRVETFDAALQASIEHEADIALALRHGVRNGELELHIQPVLNLATNSFTHAEALVRWNRGGTSMVSPGEFIPIAERSALIFEIERWVLTEACRTLVDWKQREPDLDLRLAVNISGRHLIEGDLTADLDVALAITGADPSMLEFELTETHLLEDLEQATSVLNTLRARGIAIAVDDFGTGYSSMNYLRNLPVDVIKIDRSFVARSTEAGYDSTVIEAILTIARSLGLEVVAEGIETVEQLEYIRTVGCDRAQGFLLARPVSIDEAAKVVLDQPALIPSS